MSRNDELPEERLLREGDENRGAGQNNNERKKDLQDFDEWVLADSWRHAACPSVVFATGADFKLYLFPYRCIGTKSCVWFHFDEHDVDGIRIAIRRLGRFADHQWCTFEHPAWRNRVDER
ncbi:MAG TPA: hypothetical protein PLY87_10160 [Planctomycetaceae bacterium]|nr:hypothetical protein [Planctomycetaceae bacterium]